MPRVKQASFAGGVISRNLHARTDLAKHAVALARAHNVIIAAEGSVSNRAGFEYTQTSKEVSRPARLIPFEFNVEQQYVLEFGHEYMRVVKDRSYVYEDAKTITGVTLTMPPVVTSAAHGYANGDEIYISGIAGTTELNLRSFLVASAGANTFTLKNLDGALIDATDYTAYISGGTAERVYQLTTPYDSADLLADAADPLKPGLKYAQFKDTMTLTHPGYVTRDLTRTDHDAWTLTQTTFRPSVDYPLTIALSGSGTGYTKRYTVTAVDDESGEESLMGLNPSPWVITAATQADPCVITVSGSPTNVYEGDELFIAGVVGMTELNDERYIVDDVTGSDITLKDVDSTHFAAYTSGGTASVTYVGLTADASSDVTITWARPATGSTSRYNVYKSFQGGFGYIGSTTTEYFIDNNIAEDITDAPPQLREPFKLANNYPQCSTYHEQRKVFAGSNNKPQTLYLGQSGAFDNFSYSVPRKDSDAITRQLASRQANEIRHVVPMTDLIILTSGGEWRVRSADTGPITPTSINAKPQTQHGSAHIAPIVHGDNLLFVQRDHRVLRDLSYKFDKDGYTGSDRTLLAKELFDNNPIVDMAWQDEPESIVWCVLSDGTLASMTFVPDQDVWAWATHDTAGTVESVCRVTESNRAALYILVKRTIAGTEKRFIERLSYRAEADPQDLKFVDSSLSLDAPIVITGYTNADPVVVTTATAHGFSNGDTIDITGVKVTPDDTAADATIDDDETNPYEYATINRNGFTVANVTTFTFELQDSDSADIDGTSWRVYASGGEVRKAVTTVTGLWHLVGASVTGTGNGDTIAPVTVSADGEVTLQDAASRVTLGLAYYSEIETLDLDFSDEAGDSDTRKQRSASVYLRVVDTRGLKAGPARDKLTAMKQALNETTTGIVSQSIKAPWRREARVVVRQDNPMPMTISAISTRPQIEDDG